MTKITITETDLNTLVLREANAVALCLLLQAFPKTEDREVLRELLEGCRSLAALLLQSYGLNPATVDAANGTTRAPDLTLDPNEEEVLRWPPPKPSVAPLPKVYTANLYELRESIESGFEAGAHVAFRGECEWSDGSLAWLMKVYLGPVYTQSCWVSSKILKPTDLASPLAPKAPSQGEEI